MFDIPLSLDITLGPYWDIQSVSTQKHSDGVVTKGWQLTTEPVKDELNEGLTVQITQRRRIHGKYTWCLISGAVFWCLMRTSCPLGKDMLICNFAHFLDHYPAGLQL